MKRILFTILATVALFQGCGVKMSREDATRYALEKAYSTTGRTLVVMRKQGQISDNDWQNIQIVSNKANTILQEWHEVDKNGTASDLKKLTSMPYLLGPLLEVMNDMLENSLQDGNVLDIDSIVIDTMEGAFNGPED